MTATHAVTGADAVAAGGVPDARRGAPARFDGANVLRGLAAARSGEIVSLNLQLDDPIAPFGRAPFERTMRLHNDVRPLGDGRYIVINDDEVSFALQGSSQWDAFAHFGAIIPGSPGVYTGGAEFSETFRTDSPATLGMQALGPGIVTRGVLLDFVAVAGGAEGFVPGEVRLNADHVRAALSRQEVAIEPGDAVLIYTGYERRRASLGGAFPDVVAGLDGSTVPLWEQFDILALAADNSAVEATPADFSIHIGLLRDRGIPLGELWALEALATACRARGQWDFTLASVPLNIPTAFGSTANAIAIL